MDYFFLIASVSLGTATSLISRIVKKGTRRLCETSATNTVNFFIAFLTIFLLGLLSQKGNFFSGLHAVNWFLAIAYGACLLLAQFFFLLALGRGPVSISTLFYACGFILPTLYGVVRFNEPIRPTQIVGLGLIILSFILSTSLKKDGKKADFLWLVFVLCALLFSGGIGIVQKEYAFENACPVDNFLFVAVAFTCLFSLLLTIALFIKDRRNGIPRDKTNLKSVLCSSLLLGAVMGTANKLNTYLAGVFTSVITFPVVNGGRILLTTVLGAILFREKTNLRQKIGILCGFIAIVLIAI